MDIIERLQHRANVLNRNGSPLIATVELIDAASEIERLRADKAKLVAQNDQLRSMQREMQITTNEALADRAKLEIGNRAYQRINAELNTEVERISEWNDRLAADVMRWKTKYRKHTDKPGESDG